MGGAPLPMTPAMPPAIPACGHCGGRRVFELQLLPTLTSYLEWTAASQARAAAVTRPALPEGFSARGLSAEDAARIQALLASDAPLEVGNVLVWSCERGCDVDLSDEFVFVQPPM
jgi:pre-rRNA-processing protein TSR4